MKKVIIPVIIVYLLFLFSGCSNARPEGVNESQKTTPTQTITNDTSNTENKTNAEIKHPGEPQPNLKNIKSAILQRAEILLLQ